MIYDIDAEVMKRDMQSLCDGDGMLAGLMVSKFYFFHHMLKVKVPSKGQGSNGFVSFFDVYADIENLMNKYDYIKRAVDYSMNRFPNKMFPYHVYDAYRLYYGHVSIFKPMLAKRLV